METGTVDMAEQLNWILGIALALTVGLLIGILTGRGRKRGAADVEPVAPTPSVPPIPPIPPGPPEVPGADAAGAAASDHESAALYRIAGRLSSIFDQAARPGDVLGNPVFEEGVALLTGADWSVDTLLGHYRGDSLITACLALEALRRREDDGADLRDTILQSINDFAPWNRYFALRLIDSKTPADGAIVGRTLLRIDETWLWPQNLRLLEEFVRRRLQGGESIVLDRDSEPGDEDTVTTIEELTRKFPKETAEPLRAAFDSWRGSRIDHELLGSIGRVWAADEAAQDRVIEHPALTREVATLRSVLLESPRRSAVLVGDHGVGKTSTVRALAARAAEQGWSVFEAGHAELIAGQTYVGQFEERMRSLLGALRGRPLLWFVPDFHTLALAGRHRFGPLSALDIMLPAIERGEILVVGETSSTAFEQLVQSKPRVLTAMEVCRMGALPERATQDLVERWVEDRLGGEQGLAAETRAEAWLLAQQYLGDRAAPGNVLKLLDLTRQRLATADPGAPLRIGAEDLIATLTQLTGLPASILDERQGLDLGALRSFFERRVMGQPEAIDCLVERVAMIKAGVADPSRPLGVFLFAGPTGTGKTEIAKALAEFLFGSERRMLRLDMSEFQTPEAIDRILGGADPDQRGGALIDRIRKQPFSVILLDEFEKSHPNVWDIFLQVFDDGRLTDRTGRTADFRNAIVILTSNLGSMIPVGQGLGFQDDSGRFSEGNVRRAIEKSFRKEFINRLDRVVVFRPLERETMRTILRKELSAAFRRRGLRNRAWAVEWDESAVELLLREGFTVDLGARPLRRAIERRLLAPLSMTIVNHQYPEGDQFLLVRAEDGRLRVEFVDPDAPEPDGDGVEASAAPEPDGAVTVERIALEPAGTAAELVTLRAAYDRLQRTVDEQTWTDAKKRSLERMRQPGFWESDERYETLAFVEYVDRLEAGVRSAGSLLDRLEGGGAVRDRYPRKLLSTIATSLFVLDEACRGLLGGQPREAFIRVEAWSDSGRPSREADAFARRIAGMYRAWADLRRMPCELLAEWGEESRDAYGQVLAVSGYGAYSLLAGEGGLHVLELPDGEGKGHRRAAVRVRIAPQPNRPPEPGDTVLRQARAAFEKDEASVSLVRRYRERPSPLVRDSVGGWRTGKLDRVLGGDFDLVARVRGGRRDDESGGAPAGPA